MGNKKILFFMPEALLSEIDEMSSDENVSRSEWIRRAVKARLLSERKKRTEASLRRGYEEMGSINKRLAEESIAADNEQLLTYELKLSESE